MTFFTGQRPGWRSLLWTPVSFLNPASGRGRGFQSKLHALQSSTAFSTPYTLCGKQPFCTWGFASLQPESASTNFKVLHEGWGHQWSLRILLHNKLVEGWISISDSARHSPAPLSKLVRTQGPKAKLIVHKLIQPPWFCLFKWDS